MTPLGIRNNNPGNIRKGGDWQGMDILATNTRGKGFIVFKDMFYGCRALLYVLKIYYDKHQLKTVKQILTRYAPEIENPLNNYIQHVCSELNVEAMDKLPRTKETMVTLAKAIVFFECGKPASTWIQDEVWDEAYSAIFN